MTHAEIIKKLIGPIQPAGESHVDDKRMENLRAMCSLIDELVSDVRRVAESKDRHEYSMKKMGEYADKFLKTLNE